jgi:hypothetical protein
MAFAVQVAAQAQTKSWHYRDLTAATGAPRPAGQLAGFHVGDRDDPRVYYSDNNGRVWELAYYQASPALYPQIMLDMDIPRSA